MLAPGKLILVSGDGPRMRHFLQELTHFAIHRRPGVVLWCDGEHGFNPYDFAELNLEHGHDADWGAERVLIKRCMTPFQWDTVLTRHIAVKLKEVGASLVLAAPYHNLFSTDELSDWEREDYIDHSLRHLKGLARSHRVPVVLSVDMAVWSRDYPQVAWKAYEACEARWAVRPTAAGWLALEVVSGVECSSRPSRQRTIADFEPRPPALRRNARFQEAEHPIPAVAGAA